MPNNIEIEINPSDEVEEFEEQDRNVAKVQVRLPSGDIVGSEEYTVVITLSRNAMLGIGKELIRSAYKDEDRTPHNWHLRPTDPSLPTQILGVFLHPDSCELIVGEQEMGTLENILDEK